MHKPFFLIVVFVSVVYPMLVCCTSSSTTQTTTPPSTTPPSTTQTTPPAKPEAPKEATTAAPRLRFNPPVLVTTPDSAGYVTAKVYIYNDGGGTLMMSEVKASCGCAGASVQRNKVSHLDSGMIYIQINAKAFTEASNNVDFTVKSNASNSPTIFRAIINRR